MKTTTILALTVAILILISAPTASAYVPYLEKGDYSKAHPFPIQKVEQSIAVYAWLSTGHRSFSDDIDVYAFEVTAPVSIYLSVLVPVCDGYEDYAPWFALVGPNMPDPGEPLPFEIPAGYGAVVLHNTEPGQPREQFWEPFGGKAYYQGPEFKETMDEPGVY